MRFGISPVLLARRKLLHGKGPTLAVLLTLVSLITLFLLSVGYVEGLVNDHLEFLTRLDGTLVLSRSAKPPFFTGLDRLPPSALATARECSSVATVAELRIERRAASWRDPATGSAIPLSIIAFDSARPPFALSASDTASMSLSERGAVWFDRRAHEALGDVATGIVVTQSDHPARVVGRVSFSADLSGQAALLVSDETYETWFPSNERSGGADLALVTLAPGSDIEAAVAQLRSVLPGDVRLMPRDTLVDLERAHWRRHAPLLGLFNWSMVPLLLVLAMTHELYLSSSRSEDVPEFAMLGLLGYQRSFATYVLFSELSLLTLLGSLIAWPVAWTAQMLIVWLTPSTVVISLRALGLVLLFSLGACYVIAHWNARRNSIGRGNLFA